MNATEHLGWQGRTLQMQKHEALLRKASFAGILMVMAGVVTSPFLLSVGIVLTMLSGLLLMPFKEQIRRFWQHKPAVLMSLLFILQVLSGIWTRESGLDHWLEEIKIKIPLFLGMYGLAVLGPIPLKWARYAFLVLILATTTVATVTTVQYLLDPGGVEERIAVSKEVVVWLETNNHIYFSIVTAFSILASIWSIWIPGQLFKYHKLLTGILALICFAEMHVLTTRTGLLGLYLTVLILGLAILLKKRKIFLALALVGGLSLAPVLGFYTVESFRLRIDNTLFDLGTYFRGGDPNYLSIGTRIESWLTAYHLWQSHPILGVAMADLEADITDQYVEDKTRLCPENFVKPHNQFIQNLAGWGLVGFLLLVIAWFYPVFSRKWPKGMLFWIFWLTFTLAMMGESTMERQVGVCFMVTTFMMGLGVAEQEPKVL